jgi:hypothetical protein
VQKSNNLDRNGTKVRGFRRLKWRQENDED